MVSRSDLWSFTLVELFRFLRHLVQNYPRFKEVYDNCPACWFISALLFTAPIGGVAGAFFNAPHGDKSLALAGAILTPMTILTATIAYAIL